MKRKMQLGMVVALAALGGSSTRGADGPIVPSKELHQIVVLSTMPFYVSNGGVMLTYWRDGDVPTFLFGGSMLMFDATAIDWKVPPHLASPPPVVEEPLTPSTPPTVRPPKPDGGLVIVPLPAALWTGLTTLAGLATVGAARKLRTRK